MIAISLVGTCISVLVAVMLGFQNHQFQTQLTAVSKVVAAREEADPLTAWECELGNPSCYTMFGRLLSNPHSFHNRRIHVRALYLSGFEMAAFFNPIQEPGEIDLGKGIWLESIAPGTEWPKDLNGKIVVVEGTFINRSSGHMTQYFGRLENVELQSVSEN